MPDLVDCGFYPGGNNRPKGPHEHEGSFTMPADKKVDVEAKDVAVDDKKKESKKK